MLRFSVEYEGNRYTCSLEDDVVHWLDEKNVKLGSSQERELNGYFFNDSLDFETWPKIGDINTDILSESGFSYYCRQAELEAKKDEQGRWRISPASLKELAPRSQAKPTIVVNEKKYELVVDVAKDTRFRAETFNAWGERDLIPYVKRNRRFYTTREVAAVKNLCQPLLSIGESAELFRVSRQTVRSWVRKRKLKTVKTPGGTNYLLSSEIF